MAEDFRARVVQHEYDRLIGKLYPMRITDFSKFGFTEVLFPAPGSTRKRTIEPPGDATPEKQNARGCGRFA